MTRTPTLPVDDRGMWRKARRPFHPDAGGDPEIFIWLTSVMESVCGEQAHASETPLRHPHRRHNTATGSDPDRIPYALDTDFEETTRTALRIVSLGMPYGRVLSLLADCRPLDHLAHEQARGASYKRLAAIGHLWGMTKRERVGWYRVAEDIPLADRHASHILGRLKRRAA